MCNGPAQVFGRIKGELRASDLTIGDGAEIEGSVIAQDVTGCGRVKGTIRAVRVKLQDGGAGESKIQRNRRRSMLKGRRKKTCRGRLWLHLCIQLKRRAPLTGLRSRPSRSIRARISAVCALQAYARCNFVELLCHIYRKTA